MTYPSETFPSETVVFDFDYTLTSWDSADRFFRWLLRRNLWRLGLIAVSLPILAPLLLSPRTKRLPIRFAIWVATLGLTEQRIEALVKEHVGQIIERGELLIMRDGSRQLGWHHEQGHKVVIATGSLEVLAKEFLANCGLGHIPLVGSSLKPFLWGLVSKDHCFGERKIPMLSQRGFPPPWKVTYTDHQCDLPVLKLSQERFLVNPKPRAVELVLRELSSSPRILVWK